MDQKLIRHGRGWWECGPACVHSSHWWNKMEKDGNIPVRVLNMHTPTWDRPAYLRRPARVLVGGRS